MRVFVVAVWKIGAWPGLGTGNTPETKSRYVQYALRYNFVAVGSAYIPNLKTQSEEEIKNKLERVGRDKGTITKRTKELLNFANKIREGDAGLLYVNLKEVYVGMVKQNEVSKEPYYYVERGSKEDYFGTRTREDLLDNNTEAETEEVEDNAPHRINVKWEFERKGFKVDFGDWRDTLHQVNEEDLTKVEDEKLKSWLKKKIEG